VKNKRARTELEMAEILCELKGIINDLLALERASGE
jgi:hypothetical protein